MQSFGTQSWHHKNKLSRIKQLFLVLVTEWRIFADIPSWLSSSAWYIPAATKLGQGNVFTCVCDSVNRGGLPQCMLGYPPEQTTPPGPDPTPPHPPGADTPPSRHTPPGKQTPGYGQRAAGMHPTGMHSCFDDKFTQHLDVTSASASSLWNGSRTRFQMSWQASLCVNRSLGQNRQITLKNDVVPHNPSRCIKM